MKKVLKVQAAALDHIRNDRIREMEVEGNILETIETKRLIRYGHLQRNR